VLKEVNDSFEVEFRAQQIEEYVLAVALVVLSYYACHLVLHGECAGSVRKARDHLSNRSLKGKDFFLKVFTLLFQGVSLLSDGSELLSDCL